MKKCNTVNLLYNNTYTIEIELPDTYKEFIEYITKKLYLTPELVKTAKIYYIDTEDDKNPLIEENYAEGISDSNGNWIMEIELDKMKISNDDDNNQNDSDNKNDSQKNEQEIFELEKKIVKKISNIYKNKVNQLENEMINMKKDYEGAIETIISENEKQIEELNKFFNDKMKVYFDKYNELILENLQNGISKSNLDKLQEGFINEMNDEDKGNGDDYCLFSKVVDK